MVATAARTLASEWQTASGRGLEEGSQENSYTTEHTSTAQSRTFQGLDIHLKVGKHMNVFVKDLRVYVHRACCPPCLLAQTQS